MKNLLLITLFTITHLWTSAAELDSPKVYKWNHPVFMTVVDVPDKNISTKGLEMIEKQIPDSQLSQTGQLFKIIMPRNEREDGKTLIKILNYKKYTRKWYKPCKSPRNIAYDKYNSKKVDLSEGDQTSTEVDLFFEVPDDWIDQYAKESRYIRGGLSIGVLYFPFKFRPQQGVQDFEGAFNLGAALGYTWGHNEDNPWTFSLLGGFSLANLRVSERAVKYNSDLLKNTNDFSAISFSLGAILQYEKVQAGVFLGVDRLSYNNHKTFGWIYQGKPWVSIGFGYAVFTPQKSKSSKNQN